MSSVQTSFCISYVETGIVLCIDLKLLHFEIRLW